MIAGLSDIQSMTGALMVFDMTSIESTATALAAREDFISKIDELPDAAKEGHAKVARAAEDVALAAAAGEEQEVSAALAEVTSACSSCHYDLRDKKRREKMQ
jgi:cytochrome c556